jgi:hypothetical protein
VQPVDVFSLGVGGVLVESRCLADGFGQVFHEVADVTASFLAATQDALDMDLFAEADDVGGFGQLLAGLFSVLQRGAGGGVGEGLSPRIPHR